MPPVPFEFAFSAVHADDDEVAPSPVVWYIRLDLRIRRVAVEAALRGYRKYGYSSAAAVDAFAAGETCSASQGSQAMSPPGRAPWGSAY